MGLTLAPGFAPQASISVGPDSCRGHPARRLVPLFILNLYCDNILVTPDNQVFVLDFAGALLNPTDKQVKAEKSRIGFRKS